MIVEVMGRNAGFIALHGGMAGGADVILIPEIPYRLERVVAKIREREALGLRFSIVVIAEGARPLAGDVLEIAPGKQGYLPRLGGAGARLLHEIERSGVDHEVRLTVLGHLQRGGSPTTLDRNLGTQLGAFAARTCASDLRTCLLAVRDGRIVATPLPAEDLLHRRVALDGPLIEAARSVGIELGADAREAPHP
jgi:6-phosphofructokinase 1